MPTGRPPGRKTYSRLTAGRRVPSEYEVVSSDLHYNHPNKFELGDENPVVAWYYRHREGSTLAADWEAFSDPRRTTYRGYNELQDRAEDVVDGLLREIDDTDYDSRLAAAWVEFLDRWYAPLRFPVHGLQMLASYVAQLAPASRITNCAAFQAADEVRRLQRIAYRTAQLAARHAEINTDHHRRTWEQADEFQPLRELIERALVTYDWGEAFVLTNLVIKPHVDRLINQELAGALAAANDDPLLQSIHFSLDEDARWHCQWSVALLDLAIADRHDNAKVVADCIDRWGTLADDAVASLASVLAKAPRPLDPTAVNERITASLTAELDSIRSRV